MSETPTPESMSEAEPREEQPSPLRTEVKRRSRDGEVFDADVHTKDIEHPPRTPDINEKAEESGSGEDDSIENNDNDSDEESGSKNGEKGADGDKKKDGKEKKPWFPFNRNKKQKSFTVEVYQLPFRNGADSKGDKDDGEVNGETPHTEEAENSKDQEELETPEDKLPPVPSGAKSVARVTFEA
jgi:hypothetical protein